MSSAYSTILYLTMGPKLNSYLFFKAQSEVLFPKKISLTNSPAWGSPAFLLFLCSVLLCFPGTPHHNCFLVYLIESRDHVSFISNICQVYSRCSVSVCKQMTEWTNTRRKECSLSGPRWPSLPPQTPGSPFYTPQPGTRESSHGLWALALFCFWQP